MRQLLRAGLIAWAAVQSVTAVAQELRIGVRETVTVEFPGATAAFALDADIVEASALGNQLVLVGRRAGQTLVTIVTPAMVETLTVRVDAPPSSTQVFEHAAARAASTFELGYDSGNRRYSTRLSMPFGEGERRGRLNLYGIREESVDGGDDIWALPSASIEFKQPGRSLVLLDELVNVSPLTLNYNVLRGIHLREGALEMHAGIASATPWNDLLLPSSGDRAAALSYRSDAGPVQLVPRLLWLPDSTTEVPGVFALGVERGTIQDPLWLKAELGWSEKPGASLDLNFRSQQRQVWLQATTRPPEFAALSVARPAGSYLDGAWSEGFGKRSTASLTLSASRLNLLEREPEAASGRLELRHQTTDRWSFTTGAGESIYSDAGIATLHRSTASLGTAYDMSSFGIAALYRYQESSSASRAGHGGRVTMRGASGAWRANLFVDAQQQSPTLDLIFQDRPDLERAFAELGFVASTPEEVLRLLRDNAALFAARGITVGELRISPLRLQGGFDIAWRRPGARGPEIGLRLLADDVEGAASERRSYLSTLYSSWPVFRHTELLMSYVRWSAEREALPGYTRDSYQLTLRTRFSAPSLPGSSRRPISGRVLRDDLATGSVEDARTPLAGVEVVLDGSRRTRTDADGWFSFAGPGPGEHRVQAILPPEPGAYFTLPSAVNLSAGGEAQFAITFSAARVTGTVRSDAGLPLAGVTVRLQGPTQATATTDSSGTFRFAGPEGVAQVSVVADSVPPGYELSDLKPQSLLLAKRAPADLVFTVRAQRVLTGVVKGAGSEPITVIAVETEQAVNPDKSGRFLLRALPAGLLTLVVESRYGKTRQVIEIPAEPGPVSGVELIAPSGRR